jgi:hypothetical protein
LCHWKTKHLEQPKKCQIHLLGQEGSDKEYCGDSRVRLLSSFRTVSHQNEQPWHRNVWKLWKRIQRPSPWAVECRAIMTVPSYF